MVGRYAATFIKLTLSRKVSTFLFANIVTVEWSKFNATVTASWMWAINEVDEVNHCPTLNCQQAVG